MHFAGEDAIDTGGPSREFWRVFVREVCEEYFAGVDGKLTIFEKYSSLGGKQNRLILKQCL